MARTAGGANAAHAVTDPTMVESSSLANDENCRSAGHSPSNETNDEDNGTIKNDILNSLTIECLVDVEDRMWPGMNKQGGIARIKGIDRINRCVDLHYVVDRRKEKKVDLEFITLAPQYEVDRPSSSGTGAQATIGKAPAPTSLRDRSMLLGRCKLCGSLRTDCGSCDWLEEERRHREGTDDRPTTSAGNTNDMTGKKSHRLSNNQRKMSRTTSDSITKHYDDVFLGLSDSSDEDDLADLIQEQRQKFRRLERRKARQDKEFEKYLQREQQEQQAALARAQQRVQPDEAASRNRKDNDASKFPRQYEKSLASLNSSSSEDEDIPLIRLSFGNLKHRRLSKLKQKYERPRSWPSNSGTKTKTTTKNKQQGNRPPPTKLQTKQQVATYYELESLPTKRFTGTGKTQGSSKKSTTRVSLSRRQQSTSKVVMPLQNNDGDNNSLITPRPQTLSPGSINTDREAPATSHPSTPPNRDGEDGNHCSSPLQFTQSFTQDLGDDYDDEEDEKESNEDDVDVSMCMTNNDDDNVDEVLHQQVYEQADGQLQQESQGLEGFIQPEGIDVAENLPNDVQDRASEVPYKDLPRFFDEEATRIEDELLPDAKMHVAQLERDFYKWERQNSSLDSLASNNAQWTKLMATCDFMMDDIRANLIWDGIDQCRSALRQLLSDSRYRRERSTLSQEERRQMKHQRDNLGFIRDNRLDELDRDVEGLVQKIRRAQMSLESHDTALLEEQQQQCSDSDNYSDSDKYCDSILFGNANDSLSPSADDSVDIENEDITDTRVEPPWDTHFYAMRKRTPLTEAQEISHSSRMNFAKRAESRKIVNKRSRSVSSGEPTSACVSGARIQRNQQARKLHFLNFDGGGYDNYDDHQTLLDSKGTSNVTTVHSSTFGSKANNTTKKADGRVNKHHQGLVSNTSSLGGKSTVIKDHCDHATDAPFIQDSTAQSRKDSKRDDANFPRLEDLLDVREVLGTDNFHGKESQCCGVQKRSRIQHMQAFLASNGIGSEYLDSGGSEDEPSDGFNSEFQRKRKRRNKATYGSQSAASLKGKCRDISSHQCGPQFGTIRRDDIVSGEESAQDHMGNVLGSAQDIRYPSLSPQDLFAPLKDKSRRPHVMQERKEEIFSLELPELFHNLPNICPFTFPRVFVNQLKGVISGTISQIQASDDRSKHPSLSLQCFQTILRVLQSFGNNTLQELISGGDIIRLRTHLVLLQQILRLFENGIHYNLKSEDGLVFHIFSKAHNNSFVLSIVLQFVDALYGIFLPVAWATAPGRELAVLNLLVPLRDALKSAAPLAKVAFRCIHNYLECQEWRLSETPKRRAFVSSVDPVSWRRLLQSGVGPQEVSASRMSRFKDGIPHCEIQVLWSILAFVATPTASNLRNNESDDCWLFASKLVARGVLAGEKKSDKIAQPLPPSESQLDQCQIEIGFLAFILESGTAEKPKKGVVEILERAVALQADDYALNYASTRRMNPSLDESRNNVKEMKRLWNGMAPGLELILLGDSSSVAKYSIFPLDASKAGTLLGVTAMLPSSTIARQCLRLLSAWTQETPLAKMAINRYVVMMRSLSQHFVDEAHRAEINDAARTASSAIRPDLFALAFSSNTPSFSDTNRRAIFLREFAANVKIISALSLKCRLCSMQSIDSGTKTLSLDSLPEEVSECFIGRFMDAPLLSHCRHLTCFLRYFACRGYQVWDLTADEAMKSRVQMLSNEPVLYKGDDYRLYAAAKIVTFAALASLGIPVWNGSVWKDLRGPVILVQTDAPREDSLVYPATCLITCLSCLCDLPNCNKAIMCSICAYLTAIFTHACRLLATIEGNPHGENLVPAIRSLGNMALSSFASVFKKCFQSLASENICGSMSDASLLALLSALRGGSILALHANSNNNNSTDVTLGQPQLHQRVPQETSNVDNDPWGGLDDDAFASLDLGKLECDSQKEQATDETGNLFLFLFEALQSAKPSRKFEIEDALSSDKSGDNICNPSVQGKCLIARSDHYICGCLAILGAQKKSQMPLILRSFLENESDATKTADKNDIMYQRDLVKYTSAALCSVSSTVPGVPQAICSNREPVLLSLVTSLLDTTILAKFPTCNTHEIRKKCGRGSEEKELSHLGALQEAAKKQSTRKLVGDGVWKFCMNLGLALGSSPGSDLEQKLADLLLEVNAPSQDYSVSVELFSVEYECFRRVRLLMRILDVLAEHADIREFERICHHVMAKASYGLVTLDKEFNFYQDISEVRATCASSYAQAKVSELLSSYVAMHVTLLSWILRKSRLQHAPNYTARLEWILSKFFTSILRRDTQETFDGLHQLSMSPISNQLSKSSSPDEATQSTISSHVADLLRRCLIGRFREIFLSLCKHADTDGWLLNVVIAVSIGKVADTDEEVVEVAGLMASFALSEAVKTPLSVRRKLSAFYSFPLQQEIADYLESIQVPTSSEMKALRKWKQAILQSQLAPRLRQNLATCDAHSKKRVVNLVIKFLEAEQQPTFHLSEEEIAKSASLLSLREITRGLVFSLRDSLNPSSVDTELVSAIFLCAKALATSLISLDTTTSATCTVAQWSQSLYSSCNEQATTVPPEKLIASYLWCVLFWIKSVAEMVLDQRNDAASSIPRLCRDLQADKQKWPPLAENGEIEASLSFLNSYFFPESQKVTNIVNVYAKKPNAPAGDGGRPQEAWNTDNNLKKAANNFLAEIIPLC